MKLLLSTGASIAWLLACSAAQACGGGPVESPGWTLDKTNYAGDAGLPLLSPGNDSRINLQLLMMDAHPWPVNADWGVADAARLRDSVVLFERPDFNAAFGGGKPAAADPDQQAAPVADGEGSRCRSLAAGSQAFADAAQVEQGLSAAERTALVGARSQMNSDCGDHAGSAPARDVLAGLPQPSSVAREFAAYLAGAQAFYDGGFDQAVVQFTALAGAQNAWVKETSRYMVGRALLNKAQVGAFSAFDETGQPNVADKAVLGAAEAAFNAYLGQYPTGRYAASARGLTRRLYWLGGDKTRLAAEYEKSLAQGFGAGSAAASSDLAEEIDWKFLRPDGTQSHDANLLAVADLIRLRGDAKKRPVFPATDLEAQAAYFAGHDALFGFLRAARAYYADGDSAAALQALGPAQYGPLSPAFLDFSRESLRGQALMASGQFPAAADHWQKLRLLATQPWQKEAAELGLAMSWERAGMLNKVFLPDTRIASPRLRVQVLTYAAGPILLRQAVADPLSLPEERRLARFILLFKEATRGQYSNFLRDFSPELIAADEASAPKLTWARAAAFNWTGADSAIACPALKLTVANLASDAAGSHDLLCLTEFTRTQYMDDVEAGAPGRNELGGGKPIFPGAPYSRGEIYKKLIASPATPDADKAYALFRAVNCYAPSGVNECGGADVAKTQRKAWYDQLKRNYGSTSWAQNLRYYW